MTTTSFTTHSVETAPERAQATLQRVTERFGFTPTAVGRMADSPELLNAFLQANAHFERCSLDPVQREVVIMTVARRHVCQLCVAMHTATLHRLQADPAMVAALRDGAPLADRQLEALRLFTLTIMDRHGAATETAVGRLLAAGFQRRQALDVVLGVGVYTLSTYANRLTDAPVDEPFAPFAWAD